MGCANSKDRVERTNVDAESFEVASDLQKLQLQQALDKGSFLFTQERSASAELTAQAPETRPKLGVDSAGADAVPIGKATCTSDYDSNEDIDLQLKQVRPRPRLQHLCAARFSLLHLLVTRSGDWLPA